MAIEFATIDFETTGLSAKLDRVIEVGIVRTTADGRILREYSSLVNPSRDVGRTDIHGITAGMLRDAPTFAQIAGDVALMLNGAVMVAHNASFDARFLDAELERMSCAREDIDALCTLELMFAGFPAGPRRLVDCCVEYGVSVLEAHSALDDARMASQLLHFLLKKVDVHVFPDPISISTDVVGSGHSLARSTVKNPRSSEANFLADLVARLPTSNPTGLVSAVSVAQYLNLLDRVLEDRKIDKSEAESLHSFATEMNLSLDKVAGLHASYVANLCSVARQDGVVTEFERNDLQLVSNLLNVSDWEPLLEMNALPSDQKINSPMLAPGLAVCFTGEMTVPRETLEERARSLELVVKTGVSKKVDILVVADSDSMSTKARKARELGIRIVSEAVFLQLLATGELPA